MFKFRLLFRRVVSAPLTVFAGPSRTSAEALATRPLSPDEAAALSPIVHEQTLRDIRRDINHDLERDIREETFWIAEDEEEQTILAVIREYTKAGWLVHRHGRDMVYFNHPKYPKRSASGACYERTVDANGDLKS